MKNIMQKEVSQRKLEADSLVSGQVVDVRRERAHGMWWAGEIYRTVGDLGERRRPCSRAGTCWSYLKVVRDSPGAEDQFARTVMK